MNVSTLFQLSKPLINFPPLNLSQEIFARFLGVRGTFAASTSSEKIYDGGMKRKKAAAVSQDNIAAKKKVIKMGYQLK